MIQVENLVRRYGDHMAVDHLSFTVEAGKIYGFVGPNGAGKSTTMNVMTGYIAASSGTVVIDGHDVLKEPLALNRGFLVTILKKVSSANSSAICMLLTYRFKKRIKPSL